MQTVGQIALIPLFLHSWGDVRYGEWLVVFSVPLYFSLSDVGINNALGNALTLAVSGGSQDKASRMVSSAWRGQLLLGAALLVAAAAAVWALPLRALLGIEAMAVDEFRAALLALSVYVLLVVQTGVLSSVFRAARQYDRYQWILGHTRAVEIGATVVVLWLAQGLVVLAAALAAVRLGGLCWTLAAARRALPSCRLAWSLGSWAEYRSLLPDGAAFFAFPVSNAIANQGTILVVQHLGGPVAVVLVSVCRQLARLFSQGVSLLLGSLHPELTSAYAAGDFARMRRMQAQVVSFAFWAAWPFLAGVAVAGPWVLELWTGSMQAGRGDLVLFALEAVIVAVGSLVTLSAWSVSRVRGLAFAYLAAQGLALALAAALYPQLGVVAVAVGFAGTNLVYAIYGAVVNAAVLQTPTGTFLGDCARGLPGWFRDRWLPGRVASN